MIRLWTIGHSNHSWAQFEALLRSASVDVIADIRSKPSSRFPHFRRAQLSARLTACTIDYVFLGRELGGCSEDGPVDYEKRATEPLFLQGLARVEEIAQQSRVALMCSEGEPLECHRCLLVGRRLTQRGVCISNILRDGKIEPHAETEERLLELTRLAKADMLISRAERLDRAYRDQSARLQTIRAGR